MFLSSTSEDNSLKKRGGPPSFCTINVLSGFGYFQYRGQCLFLAPVSFSEVRSNNQIVNQLGHFKNGICAHSSVCRSVFPGACNENEKLQRITWERLLKAQIPGPPSPTRLQRVWIRFRETVLFKSFRNFKFGFLIYNLIHGQIWSSQTNHRDLIPCHK